MDPAKLDRIREAPRPQTKKQVRSFLGLVGYYRRFIPNFAKMAVPLTDLTRKGQPNLVRWGKAQERSFTDLSAGTGSNPEAPEYEQIVTANCIRHWGGSSAPTAT